MAVNIPHSNLLPAIVVEKKDEHEGHLDPTEDNLLRLAGGHVGMTWQSSKDALALRTILAHRALHVKDRLRDKAAEIGRKSVKKKGFVEKSIMPFFQDTYETSSDGEDEEKEKKRRKEDKEKARAARREQRRLNKRLKNIAV